MKELINNNESKARLFSLYYDQMVANCINSAGELQLFRVLSCTMVDEVEYLTLYSASKLTQEQAIIVARLTYGDKIISYSTATPSIVWVKVKTEHGARSRYISEGNLNWKAHQYLLSQSIALPFYCSIEKRVIDVSEQIELGFIKIRTI